MTNESQVFCLVVATPVGEGGRGVVRLVCPFSPFDQSLGLDSWKGSRGGSRISIGGCTRHTGRTGEAFSAEVRKRKNFSPF